MLAAAWLAAWLRRNERGMRAMDYGLAGVFSVFAVKVLLAQARCARQSLS